MVYPSQWRRIEQQYGESMETLLPRKANELGSLKAVATEFGVRHETIWKWGKRIGLVRSSQFHSENIIEAASASGR